MRVRTKARDLAARYRHRVADENKENLSALLSVVAVRTDTRLAEEDTRHQNRMKHISMIQWVTEVNTKMFPNHTQTPGQSHSINKQTGINTGWLHHPGTNPGGEL
ncbi:unnamed protein product [Macrosiphum euphorbiae]|uniref:Uncharacterized protein n=1 Tax=Macrosiphum euphorbiae TaxID=13131 RepID=A0AAV0YB20_9HEMI|nr:unnamed protein product [Macrosiphum euphorbiae]